MKLYYSKVSYLQSNFQQVYLCWGSPELPGFFSAVCNWYQPFPLLIYFKQIQMWNQLEGVQLILPVFLPKYVAITSTYFINERVCSQNVIIFYIVTNALSYPRHFERATNSNFSVASLGLSNLDVFFASCLLFVMTFASFFTLILSGLSK